MELSLQTFDQICRACLTESSNMKSLFLKLEGGQELIDLLILTANIQVNREDGLPKQICGDCEAFLYKADEFQRRCKESETILNNLHLSSSEQNFMKHDEKIDKSDVKVLGLDTPGSKPDFMNLFANTDISFKKVEVKKEVNLEFDEKDCSNDFDDHEELSIPLEIKQENEEIKTYKCACSEEFKSKEKYKTHLQISNCNKKKNNKMPVTSKICIPIRNELACPNCDQIFDSVSNWSIHQKTHVNNLKDRVLPQFQCSLCLRKFKNKKSLTRHIKRHEARDSVKYVCAKCKREFKYKGFLESHMLSVHGKSLEGFICEYCPEKFLTKENLEVHSNSHKMKKNICPFCDKSFLMTCTLKDHLRIHTGEKPFLCSVCGRGFSQKTNLGQHMRRHMGVKPYKCEICSMGFVSKGELDSHTRKHTGAHPFICDECGNGFTTSSALVKHRRTHTGERPYACDLCPMKFAATGTLKNHRRTHTGERPYQCSHCEKSFVQRSDLISHIRCHTGERPFICSQCGQAFRKAAAMKAHVKMHTRESQNGMTLAGGAMLNGNQNVV